MIHTRSHISKLGAFSLVCRLKYLFSIIKTRSHISKLGAFSLICQFFPQHDPHKITHLQTRGILPSLSTKLSFLNMIQTRSQISKLGAFSLVCQWVRVSSQEHVSIFIPNNIDLQNHPNFSKQYHCFFIISLIRENSQSLHLFNCLRRIQPYKLQEKCKYVYTSLMTLIPSKWKRTVLFCNLRVCQHVFPRNKSFSRFSFT
jgi:hypothetical protein